MSLTPDPAPTSGPAPEVVDVRHVRSPRAGLPDSINVQSSYLALLVSPLGHTQIRGTGSAMYSMHH